MWRQISIVTLLLCASTLAFAQAKKDDKSSPRPAPPPPRPPAPQTTRPPVVLLPSGKPVTSSPNARTVGSGSMHIQVTPFGARTAAAAPTLGPRSLTGSFFAPQPTPYYAGVGYYNPFPFNGYGSNNFNNFNNFNGWSNYDYPGSYGARDTFFGAINAYPSSGSSASLFPMSFSSWATQLFGSSFAGDLSAENTSPQRTLNGISLTASYADIKVDLLKGDRMRLEWMGDPVHVRSVEFQELNRTDEVLTSRVVYRMPFEVVMPIPSELAIVVVKVNYHLDGTQTTRLPLATIMTRLQPR